ncbi:MAG: S8 family serine peptidase [Alkalilacustris sp.]
MKRLTTAACLLLTATALAPLTVTPAAAQPPVFSSDALNGAFVLSNRNRVPPGHARRDANETDTSDQTVTAPEPAPTEPALPPAPTLQAWMSPEVGQAWAMGFRGQGATITVVDDFVGNFRSFTGNLGDGSQTRLHGEWTLQQASMIAPMATMVAHDWGAGAVRLAPERLNVLNLSYAIFTRSGSTIGWGPRENSIIAAARNGTAVVVKAAGNDSVAVTAANSSGNVDALNLSLVGQQAAIFVGALNRNGTPEARASRASYSNIAGDDPRVQQQFLTVGVDSSVIGLRGTSFAAPIISGYAAILGSKFTSATPTQIVDQLLSTARTDTIQNYSARVHGRGEASIARALAPVSIH